MISMKGYSAIMRSLGRIEGIALCEEEDIQASLIMNVDRICKILEAEMASEGESPTRFAGAPSGKGAGDNPSVSFADSSPCTGEPIRKGVHHEEEPRTP